MQCAGPLLAIAQMLQDGLVKPLAEQLSPQHFAWLQALLAGLIAQLGAPEAAESRKRLAPGIADFLAGASEAGYKFLPEHYGCLVPFLPV